MSFGDWIPGNTLGGIPMLAFYDNSFPLAIIINSSAEKHFTDLRNPYRNLSKEAQREIIADMCCNTIYGVSKTNEAEHENSRLYQAQYYDEDTCQWIDGELGIETKKPVHIGREQCTYQVSLVFHAMMPLTPEYINSMEGHRQNGGFIFEERITDELFN